MRHLIALLAIAVICLLALGCGSGSHLSADDVERFWGELLATPTPLPRETVEALQAVEGSELDLACPVSALGRSQGTPSPAEELPSLCSLLPPNPFSAEPVDYCSSEPNEEFGVEFGGGFASESQLIEMGRLCGASVDFHEKFNKPGNARLTARIDLYKSTAGAMEAFRREADTMHDYELRDMSSSDKGLLDSIGERQELRETTSTMNDEPFEETYGVLFQRRNLVARMELMYAGTIDSTTKPPSVEVMGTGPVTPVLEYARELDKKIEAAAAQQQGG